MAPVLQRYLYSPAAVLRVSGPDAQVFLQGQFTQDLVKIAPHGAAYGLWLTQKGKVMGDSLVLRLSAEEWLVVAESLPGGVLRERLESYIIADDVLVAEETEAWSYERISAEDTGLLFATTGWERPPSGEYRTAGEGFVFALPKEGNVYVWLRPAASTALEWGAVIDADTAHWERIEAGRPLIPGEMGETDLPNEAGLEATAISFTKGCYLGQEVMARLKSMGQVRRRLFRVRGVGAIPPHGAELTANGKRCGEFRGGAVRDGAWVGFAMLSLVQYDSASPLEWNGQSLVAEELS